MLALSARQTRAAENQPQPGADTQEPGKQEECEMTENQYNELITRLDRIEAALKGNRPAAPPPIQAGLGSVSAEEVNAAFPRGWPFGREKGWAVSEVPVKTLRWFLDKMAPVPGARFYDQNLEQYQLIQRWFAELESGAAKVEAPQVREPELPMEIKSELPF